MPVVFFHREYYLEKNKMSSRPTPHLLLSGSGLNDVYYSYAFYSSVNYPYFFGNFVSLLCLAIISSRRY